MEYSTRSKRQVTTTQQAQVTIFQLLEVTEATTGYEYILTIPDTQQISTQTVQSSQVAAPQPPTVVVKLQLQRPSSASSQLASFLLVNDQQPGCSRQLMFALSLKKTFNPPSVTSIKAEESQHSPSGLSSLFGSMPSVLQHQQNNTPQPFSPTTSTRPLSQSSQQSAQDSRLACTSPYKDSSHRKSSFTRPPDSSKTINSSAVLSKQKNTPSHTSHNPPNTKRILNE